MKQFNPMSVRWLLASCLSASIFCMASGCSIHHKIEPSDKPLIVNLNVKIDHEVKVKVQEDNQDLLSLEEEYLKSKRSKKKGTKS